ncbi:MAG: tetratricopeptide repeat protein [bacterium]
MIIAAIVFLGFFFTLLNSSMLANQANDWVQKNPDDPNAPSVLYYAARWCDILGDNQKAIDTYMELYNDYPNQNGLCAAGLLHCAQIQQETTGAPDLAKKYLTLIFTQYPDQTKWVTKANVILDELNHVH